MQALPIDSECKLKGVIDLVFEKVCYMQKHFNDGMGNIDDLYPNEIHLKDS